VGRANKCETRALAIDFVHNDRLKQVHSKQKRKKEKRKLSNTPLLLCVSTAQTFDAVSTLFVPRARARESCQSCQYQLLTQIHNTPHT